MTQSRKYGTLPDLDSAPAIYETPEPAPDTSIASQRTSRSPSPTSSRKSHDSDSEQGDGSRISRQHLLPSQARSHFLPARVDARGVDFSDRISNARKSYRVSHYTGRGTRRRQNDDTKITRVRDDESENSDVDESFEERIARLRRETEEVQAELKRRKQSGPQDEDGEAKAGEKHEEAMLQLSSILRDAQIATQSNSQRARRPFQSLPNGTPAGPHTTTEPSLPAASLHDESNGSAPVTNSNDIRNVLSKATSIEARLASLETTLGIPTLTPSTTNSITSALATLEKQVTVLSSATAPTLDALANQIQELTTSAEDLTTARHAARQAQEALREKNPSGTSTSRPVSRRQPSGEPKQQVSTEDGKPPSNLDDREQSEKVDALYSTLNTIEQLAPLLPAVLERLRTLRVLHADAAGAADLLAEVEKRQARAAEEMERWKGALRGMKEVMGRVSEGDGGNKAAMEKWIQELEARVVQLGTTT